MKRPYVLPQPFGSRRWLSTQLSTLLAVTMALALVGCTTSGGGHSSPSPTRSYLGKLHVIPGTIELEDFDEGDEGVAYHDLEPENQEKKEPPYRKTGVDLEWHEAASGKFNLGWTRPGEWLIYTVDVKEAGTYRIDMLVACQGAGGTFRLEFNGVDRSGPVTVPDTGGWQHLKPFSHRGVKLEAGRQVM